MDAGYLNRPRAKLKRGAALLAVWLLTSLASTPGAAAATFGPCAKGKPLQCSSVTVPLDYSGRVGGSVKLALRRLPAAQGPAQGTVVFLAGGPGESAIGALPEVGRAFRRALPRFDVVTFDQRGTGRSGSLRCGSRSEVGVLRCARRLGARRGLYRSVDSALDLEAVRQAVGVPVISLYAVSYGGRVAGEYARLFPAAIGRMVLDSPTPLYGLEALDQQRIASLPRVLASVCAGGACSRFTRSPFADLRRVTARARRRALSVSVVSPRGRKVRTRLPLSALYGLVLQSDLSSTLRLQLPAVLRSALRGDTAPIARLTLRAQTSAAGVQSRDGVNPFLNRVTHCSESNLPWSPASPPGRGRGQALQARVAARGGGGFAPFGTTTVVVNALVAGCLPWPSVPEPGRELTAPGPPAPTLVLNGEEDLRTPVEDGRRVAAGYPSAQQLVVPYVGHSVLGTDENGCAGPAVFGFLAGGPAPTACPVKPRPGRVAFPLPVRLRALPGANRMKKTLAAALLTVDDLLTQFDLTGSAKRFGGLRGGRVEIRGRLARVFGYQVFSGVKLTGRIDAGGSGFTARFKISGGGAAASSVRVLRGGRLRVRSLTGRAASAALSARLPRSAIPRTPRAEALTP